MDKLKMLARVKEIYERNGNLMEYLRSMEGKQENTLEDILISYDFQAGAYTKSYKSFPTLRDQLSYHLAEVLNKLGNHSSILEAGVGEATILGLAMPQLLQQPKQILGFDLSWSRIKEALKFLEECNLPDVELFVADLFNPPIKNNSVDLVYTVNALEPNGGKEKEALQALYRITRKYLVLLEPVYEFGSDEAKARMEKHGYVKGLYDTAIGLGYNVVEYRPFEVSLNPLNPSGLIIISKEADGVPEEQPVCCPITHGSIIKNEECYYSPESMLAYPILGKIPCLLPQNAIVATKYLQ
jgi:ubiquinone/menaquinone biosynthesis C-methylase UbiE/uncharacterized protein YbaR (Trm112 family)